MRIFYIFLSTLLTLTLNSQTIYFIEDFEDNSASAWTLEDQWTTGDLSTLWGLAGGSFNSTQILGFDDYQAGADHQGVGKAITPEIDLTNASSPIFLEALVKFRNADQGGNNETFKILISDDNGESWSSFQELSATDWERVSFDFDQYIGKSVRIAFEYLDGNASNIGAAIDNVAISSGSAFISRVDYTLTVDGGAMFSECAENIDYQITGAVVNKGSDEINSFDLIVDSGSESKTYTFETTLSNSEAYRYSIPDIINTGTTSSSYTVSIANVNGSTESDTNQSDNTWELRFDPIAIASGKGILLEEGTGTWCGHCPRGTVYISEMGKRFGKQVSTVAVHTSDPMANENYSQALSIVGGNGYPYVAIDRKISMDPDQILAPVIEELSQVAIADIDIEGYENINDFTPTIKLRFNEDISDADYNVSVILTENGLTGTSSSWEQYNVYYQSNIPMGGFELFPDLVPSSYWPYDHVARDLIGDFDGHNVIKGNYEQGATTTYTFDSYTIPLAWEKDKLKLIAVLTDQSGEVINVISKNYSEVISNDITNTTDAIIDDIKLKVFPNPTSGNITLDLALEDSADAKLIISNMIGQIVHKQDWLLTDQKLDLNQASLIKGMYIIQVQIGKKRINKKLTIR